MNTIQPHDSSVADYDALLPEPTSPVVEPEQVKPQSKAADAEFCLDAAIDETSPPSPALDKSDVAALNDSVKSDLTSDVETAFIDEPVVPLMPVFDWVGSLFKQISNTLSRLVRSIRTISVRTPAMRSDAFDRLARSEEDTRKDVQKADFKKKLVTQEPMQLSTQEHQSQKRVGDELVTETIRTEERSRSSITGDGKVVAEVKDSIRAATLQRAGAGEHMALRGGWH